MMRKAPLMVAIVLSVVTLVLAGLIVQTFRAEPLVAQPVASANEATVVGFYDAFNVALETGNSSILRRLFHPAFTSNERSVGNPSGADGMIARAFAMHRAFPGIRLVPDAITSSGNVVLARVTIMHGETGSFIGLPLPATATWGNLDIFRISRGKIAEHWGSAPDGFAVSADVEAEFTISNVSRWTIQLEEVSFEPESSLTVNAAQSPVIHVVRSGMFSVSGVHTAPDGLLPKASASGSPGLSPIYPNDSVVLESGETLIVPVGASLEMYNPNSEPATVLVLSIVQPLPGGENQAPIIDLSPPPVRGSVVASGQEMTLQPGQYRIGFGQLGIPAGLGIPTHTAVGTHLFVIERGEITISSRGEEMWVISSNTGMKSRSSAETLQAGDGAMVVAGTEQTLLNTGAEGADLIVVGLSRIGSQAEETT